VLDSPLCKLENHPIYKKTGTVRLT
jgi:hypothetical protein